MCSFSWFRLYISTQSGFLYKQIGVTVHSFISRCELVKCLSKKCVFSCFFEVLMVSAHQVDDGSLFYWRGTERVKILGSGLVSHSEGTAMHCLFIDCKLQEGLLVHFHSCILQMLLSKETYKKETKQLVKELTIVVIYNNAWFIKQLD